MKSRTYGWQFRFFGFFKAVGNMAYYYACTLHGVQGVVRVDAVLVLGEEGRVVDFAYVVIECACPDKLHVCPYAVGCLGGEVAHCH